VVGYHPTTLGTVTVTSIHKSRNYGSRLR
jgi:hypothetical protein